MKIVRDMHKLARTVEFVLLKKKRKRVALNDRRPQKKGPPKELR